MAYNSWFLSVFSSEETSFFFFVFFFLAFIHYINTNEHRANIAWICVNFLSLLCLFTYHVFTVQYSSQFSFTTCWYEWLRKMVVSRQSTYIFPFTICVFFFFSVCFLARLTRPVRSVHCSLCKCRTLCMRSYDDNDCFIICFIECSSWCVSNAHKTEFFIFQNV